MRKTKERGITLIALAITIIVLLILAGISITSLISDNGILKQAQNATEQHKIEEYRQELTLILLEGQLENYDSDDYNSALKNSVKTKITATGKYNLVDEEETETKDYIVAETKKEGYKYKITLTEVIYLEKSNVISETSEVSESQIPEEVTITYNSNGGQGTMTASSFIVNQTSNLKTNEYTKSGYTFNGWKDQDNNPYTDGQPITPTKDLELTAQWKLTEYRVTLSIDGALWYGRQGADNYDTEIGSSYENVSILIIYNKNGIISIEPTSHNGPTVRGWWKRDTQYNIGWKLSNASATKDSNVINDEITIPLCIRGRFGWGSSGGETIDTWGNGWKYDWNLNLNISKNNVVTLSSTDSGVHRITFMVEIWYSI